MSFRNRLTLFFILIVIVPMVSAAVVVLRLIADNETGKADARIAQGQTAAVAVYRREAARAARVARRAAGDPVLSQALRSSDRILARGRASELLGTLGGKRLLVERRGRPFVDVGNRATTASAGTVLLSSSRRPVGRVQAGVVTATQYAWQVRRLTSLHVVVREGNRRLSSTLTPAGVRALPRVGTVDLGGRSYRVATFPTPGFGREPVRVSVLSDLDATSSAVSGGRTLAAGGLLFFLAIAFGFALLISRSLQAQIGRFLDAARRLAGGDFSRGVPTDGHDEFAALGEEFNKMSRQLEARVEELDQERSRLEETIRRVGETFASNLDRDALLGIVVQTAVDGVRADGGRATTRDHRSGALEQRADAGRLGAVAEAIRTVEALSLESGEPAETADGDQHAMAFPLGEGGGRPLGLVSVARRGEPFNRSEHELFNYLAGRAAVSIENVDLHELVQRQAVTDELTGLFNHRRFQEVISAEVGRAVRFEQSLGLVMVDLDNFKRVNDTYGHQQGDVVLREVGRVLRESSREIDEPARYGGEELAVALPMTDLEGAYNLAERVRTAIEALEIPRLDGQGTLRVTASFGVAAIPETADGKGTLIAGADAALYRAKHTGKNRSERAEPAPTGGARAK